MNGILKDILKDWRVWVILVAGLILYLSSCTKLEGLEPVLTKRTVQEGKSDFLPNHTFFPGEARSFDGVAKFHTSCWYDNLGKDNHDWNKLFGVYQPSDLKKNHNSFILAWRPDIKIRDVFELCLYENIQGANVPHESAIYKVKSSQLFRFTLEEINGEYSLYVDGVLLGEQRNDKLFKVVGIISAWFGGTSKAGQTMWLWMDIY